jgi:hypothetical protein
MEDDPELAAVLRTLATMGDHKPELIYFDEWHVTIPAEVCIACSDPDAGRWVPVSFCAQAWAQIDLDPFR